MATYRFIEWQDAVGNVIADTPSINLLVEADTTITAVYEEVEAPPPKWLMPLVIIGGLGLVYLGTRKR